MSAGTRVATGVWIDLWKLWIGPILLRRPTPQSAPRATLPVGVRGSGALWFRGVVVAGLKGSRVIRMVWT